MTELAFENEMVLTVVQASLGLIDPAVRTIAVESNATDRTLTVHIATKGPFADPEFPSDLLLEIDAITAGSVTSRTEIWTEDWPARSKRLVYSARD